MIDVERWVRMLEVGDLCVLPDTLSAFRISSSSLSTRISRSQGREARRFFRDVRRKHPDVVRRRRRPARLRPGDGVPVGAATDLPPRRPRQGDAGHF
jgi:hypothetical protein